MAMGPRSDAPKLVGELARCRSHCCDDDADADDCDADDADDLAE
jgi:hypothetical protein